jgi:uncharacterized coiled-coil protein SlyX
MHRYGIEEETWFEAARTGLERRGFKLRIQPRSIIIDKESRLPRIVGSAREFLEFAEKQGLRIDQAAYAAADRYGDSRSDLSGRTTQSPFDTPPPDYVVPQQRRFETAGTVAEARRPEVSAVENRLVELRQEQERQAFERRVAQQVSLEKAELEARCTKLEERCSMLEEEKKRIGRMLAEAEMQRDLYKLSVSAAEDRLRDLQTEYETAPMSKGGDKRFDQLRRFLARELHPDLARPDTPERALREVLFKRVWAKIEQLQ